MTDCQHCGWPGGDADQVCAHHPSRLLCGSCCQAITALQDAALGMSKATRYLTGEPCKIAEHLAEQVEALVKRIRGSANAA